MCVNYRLSSLLELNALLLSPPSGENVYGRQRTLINTHTDHAHIDTLIQIHTTAPQ